MKVISEERMFQAERTVFFVFEDYQPDCGWGRLTGQEQKEMRFRRGGLGLDKNIPYQPYSKNFGKLLTEGLNS